MGPHVHLLTRRRIGLLFQTDISPNKRTNLFAALDKCDACAEYYRKHQALESALCNTQDPITWFSMERTGASILAGLNMSAAQKNASVSYRRILAPIAAGMAALAVLWMVLPLSPKSDRKQMPADAALSPVTLVARGGYPQKAEADVGFRLFHVVENGSNVAETGDLSIDDIITFTYTQVNPTGGRLALFGIQETGEIKWYYPGYNEKTSIPIKGDKVDEPLKDGISLSVNHKPGRLRIIALFSKTPVSTSEIEAAVTALRKNSTPIQDLAPILLTKYSTPPIQYSVMVEIGGRK